MDLKNLLSRVRSPRPKIFVIGFNKCGTKSLHGFFTDNGINSLHNRLPPDKNGERIPTALIIEDNIAAGRPILDGLWQFQAFSDLFFMTSDRIIEANRYFREFHRESPSAYFILNDRPVEDWIESRLSHEGGPGGSFIERYQSIMDMTRSEVIDDWRRGYAAHNAAVLQYFENNRRFMHFDITRDGPEKLISFLSADFTLDPEHWLHRGSRAERQAEQIRKKKKKRKPRKAAP